MAKPPLWTNHDTIRELRDQVARLEATNAALAAKLREWMDAPSEIHDGIIWKGSRGLIASSDDLLASLPDTGEGWLEVREALEDAAYTAHSGYLNSRAYPRTQHSGGLRECPTDLCKKWCAALDALGGTE